MIDNKIYLYPYKTFIEGIINYEFHLSERKLFNINKL